jgi:hypothetical protein
LVVRASALLALVADLAVYYAAVERLPTLSLWWDVALLALAVIPATFALVGLALPARTSRWLPLVAFALIGAAVGLEALELDVAANFVKLAAVTGVGWFFLRFFEEVSWIVLVCLLIIPIDVVSVARGPTHALIEEQPEIFDYLSVAFPVPGDTASAQLGLPDVLFFALFLGAAARFGLRVGWTWLACTLSFGATLAIAVGGDVSGLPALPLLSAAFIAVNADLLWRQIRPRRNAEASRSARPARPR